MKMNIKGLDKAINSLKDLQNRAQRLEDTHSVPVAELLTPQFMQRFTDFATFDAMVMASGFKAGTQAEFEAIPDHQWNAFISKSTRFPDWQSMLNEAGAEWAKKELGF